MARTTARAVDPGLDYSQPLRLGRDSVTYEVIAARPHLGLLAGVPALILQVLHPAIGVAVYEHSNVKSQPIERLRRTADYVGATAFAEDRAALELINRVNRRHRPVVGTNPVTGEPFTADDPELQVYVHTTEMWAFLAAFRFAGGKLSPEREDRYWAELAPIGSLLGAPFEMVPASAGDATAVLTEMEPQLALTPEGRDVIDWLLAPSGSPLLTVLRPAMPLNRLATAAMLPRSIREPVGLPTSRALDRAVRGAVRLWAALLGPLLARFALRLAGPEARRFHEAIPERTTQRGFTRDQVTGGRAAARTR